MTARGFSAPPFEHFVFGPVVRVEPKRDDPPSELRDKTRAEIAALARCRPN